MKKLIIAAAIVCAAAMSQAAATYWKATGGSFYDGTGSTETANKYTGTLLIMDAATSQSDVYDAIVAGTFDAKNAAGTLAIATGSIVSADKANEFWYDCGAAKASFYGLIIEDDKVYFSNIVGPVTATESSTVPSAIALAGQNNGTSTFSATAPTGSGFAGAGKWSAVPEPTSGLLLLLGVAGLALRRRRA